MNKIQFYILSFTSTILVAVILGQLWLAHQMQNLGNEALQTQAYVNKSRQSQVVLRQMAVRLARDSEKDVALRDLLKKYNLKVSLDVDGKKKDYP